MASPAAAARQSAMQKGYGQKAKANLGTLQKAMPCFHGPNAMGPRGQASIGIF